MDNMAELIKKHKPSAEAMRVKEGWVPYIGINKPQGLGFNKHIRLFFLNKTPYESRGVARGVAKQFLDKVKSEYGKS